MKVNMRIPLGIALLLATATVPLTVQPATACTVVGPGSDCVGGTCTVNLGHCSPGNCFVNGPDLNPPTSLDGDCDPNGNCFINLDECRNGGSCTVNVGVCEAVRVCKAAHTSPHAHTYGTGGSAGAKSDTATSGDEVGAGIVTVTDTNVDDCNGDGEPGDFDGDYDTGVGGAFFGYGPWANEPTCNYGLATHGGVIISVNDVAFGADIWFVIGADDTSGPVIEVDPVDGSVSCSTDGSITPGDPATDPTADADDCLTDPMNQAQGVGAPYATCGAGGDGGYWVFLNGLLVSETGGNPGANNPPTAGTITA